MAKRQRSVSLSFVLLRFAIVMLGCTLLCSMIWFSGLSRFQNTGIVYRGIVPSQQVEKMLAGKPETFHSPGEDFLAEYVLFGKNGEVLECNVKGKKLKALNDLLQEESQEADTLRYTYADGSTAIFHWYYRAEFADPVLRNRLPPFEYLWIATFFAAVAFCVLGNTLWLRRRLAARLKLFSEVSEKVGAQELDFVIPHAGIREYDQALDAMEHMREALYSSLSSQWAAQQERETEIAALAHDLKTPLTLVGGNAELLLEEELSENSRKMVEKILSGNERAKQYVASLLETAAGTEETFAYTSLPAVFEELCRNTTGIAETKGVRLQAQNGLEGGAEIQKEHLLRALGNVVQNAIEHTPAGKNVYLEGSMTDNGWQIVVRDEGEGFSKAALRHATERLWRGDAARGADGHNGLGLWFAAEVAKTHAAQLELRNCKTGGMVIFSFR